jgi:hypothetical protein
MRMLKYCPKQSKRRFERRFWNCKCQEKSDIDNLSEGRMQNIPKKENYRVEPAKCGGHCEIAAYHPIHSIEFLP